MNISDISVNSSGKHGMTFIELVIILFFSSYYVFPKGQLVLPMLPFLGVALLYTFAITTFDKSLKWKTIISCIALFAIYSLLYYALTDTQSISSRDNVFLKRFFSKFFQVFRLFFPVLLFYRVAVKTNLKQLVVIVVANLFFVLNVCLTTWNELEINANASRSFALTEDNANFNIGGYYFVYIVPFVLVGMVYIFQNSTKILKYLLTPVIIFLFLFLVKSQYTLSIIISGVGVFLLLYNKTSRSPKRLILLVGVLFVYLFMSSIIQVLIPMIESEDIQVRLREINILFQSGKSQGDLDSRLTLYWQTIVAFLQSPITGNRYLDFDGHATLLVVLADIGIAGGAIFYHLMFSSRNRIYSLLNNNKYDFKVFFIMLLCMGFTNPIHSSAQIAWGVWFIVPTLIQYNSIKQSSI